MSEQFNFDFYTTVDDELYEELAELVGQRIVHNEVWDDSLAEELEEEAEGAEETTAVAFDLDLYLEDGIYFELYSTICYPSLESDPLEGLEAVQNYLIPLVKKGITLIEVAVSEDDTLILVLGNGQTPQLYLEISGWTVDEWDELPSA